jgi:hypothetical protein
MVCQFLAWQNLVNLPLFTRLVPLYASANISCLTALILDFVLPRGPYLSIQFRVPFHDALPQRRVLRSYQHTLFVQWV